jgi:hypothetical protein
MRTARLTTTPAAAAADTDRSGRLLYLVIADQDGRLKRD